MFSNQTCFSKDLVFNEFNIANVENKVKTKYTIKNNIKEAGAVFLPTKNHNKANTISINIFRPNAINTWNVRAAGSFFCPLKNMNMQMTLIKEKDNNNQARSVKINPGMFSLNRMYPVITRKIFISKRKKRYLR